MLQTFPGVFSGIGEFTSTRSSSRRRSPGETASLTDPALDRILDFAGEVGLVVHPAQRHRHAVPEAGAEPIYLAQMKALLKRHPTATIIWAHTGLGRVVHPAQSSAQAAERSPNHVEIVEAMLADPALAHVHFDISWDEVAKYPSRRRRRSRARAELINAIRTASCSAPTRWRRPSAAKYLEVFDM